MRKQELPLMYDLLVTRLREWLTGHGVSEEHVAWTALLVGVAVVLGTMLLLTKLLNWLLTMLLQRLAVKTDSQLDDNLIHRRAPRYVARIIPLVVSYNLVPVVLADFPRWIPFTEGLFNIFFILLAVRIVRAVLEAIKDTLKAKEAYSGKPLDSYMQVIGMVMWIIAAMLIFSQLTGKSVVAFLTAMGAASAVLLLVFKDAIMGFVASIQISANDMVRIGDWIEMPKYGADGDVIEINLTTVKVKNWDKTVTTVPTYALIGDSFKNWRAMFEGGGRRIKRAIRIKISSIRHLTDAELDDLRRIQLLAPYIDERRAEIEAYNRDHQVDKSVPVNGRELTNVGLYRTYIDLYLAAHPGIHKEMTRMVRQLAPDEHGLPLELYCFTADTRWVMFEGVMADVFDHLLAVNQYFHLEVFESPAADDLRSVGADRSGPAVRIT
ncbi:MAG: mechanosensitive ion channel [Flavobacteriales bacterium]|nr:mechanosensitive ion channel [Flavobacteriales bacterium]